MLQLCLVIVIVAVIACETARVARVTEQSYFPNFRNAYEDHNYRGGQANGPPGLPFFGNYKTPGGNIGVGNEYYDHRSGIGGQANVVNHLIRGNDNESSIIPETGTVKIPSLSSSIRTG